MLDLDSYVWAFALVQKQSFFQKRLQIELAVLSFIPFIISNWGAASSFCISFLTRLQNVSKKFVLVLALFCVTAERSLPND